MNKVCAALLVGATLMILTSALAGAAQAGSPRFAIRLVDDAADPRAQQGSADDDHVQIAVLGIGQGGAQWVKRTSGFSGELIDAHVATGSDGQAVVQFTFTAKGAEQFAALTRNNIGHRFVVILDGKIISGPALIGGELTGGKFQIDGYFGDGEAYGLAAEMNAAAKAARPR